MKKTIQLEGLDCAGCAAELEEEIKNISGVQEASVAFATQKLTVECDGEETLSEVIATANAFEEVKVVSEDTQTNLERFLLHIENLDCPVCAEALQGDLQKIRGVNSVAVDYVTQTITLSVENENVLRKVIQKTNKFEKVRVLDGEVYQKPKKASHRKEWTCIFLSGICLAAGFITEHFATAIFLKILAYVLYAVAYITVGYPVLRATAKNLIKGRIFDENFLMTVASIGAVALGEYSEGVLVMLLYQLGELLQSIAVGSSRQSVVKLMELKSERATVLRDGEQIQLKPEEVQVGDRLLVKAGERVPTDGKLLSEKALLDTKSLTGEAELKQVACGEEILSGCINMGGVYEMECTRTYEDSAVGRILDMVENAASGKAKPEKFIAKFARIYTPIVCILALLMAVCAPLLGGLIMDGQFYFKDFGRWVHSALTFLVISCPCALIISVPLTYFSGIGTCAKNGILVKGATHLDVAAKASVIAFDKTGTLTEGNFTVCGVHTLRMGQEELLSLVAAVERNSAHPIAKAFADVRTEYTALNVSEIAGKGLTAIVDGKTVFVGNEKLMEGQGICFERKNSPYSLIYVASEKEYLGCIEVGDRIRPESKEAVAELKKLRFSRAVMLTGDRRARAEKIAQELGLREVRAELLPDEKLLIAQELKKEGGLMYVGDGINDAPVMMTADCAVSMGKLGSAAAIEASDFVLISDDLKVLPKCIKIARKTRSIVMQNIVFSIVMKTLFMALGACGILPLWLAVFADVGVMLLAVLNSFRVRIVRDK